MIIVPVGHDDTLHRFPLVTLGIAVLCLAVQIHASVSSPGEAAAVERRLAEQRLREAIWTRHGQRFVARRYPHLASCLRQRSEPASPGQEPCRKPRSEKESLAMADAVQGAREAFFRAYEAGEVVSRGDSQHRRLRALREPDGVLSHGYQPGRAAHTLVSYTFIHTDWVHLIGNLVFLLICGCNIEGRWGRTGWLLLYVMGGAAAALAWGATHATSPVPLVGASGAIAAAMGAFVLINHGARLRFVYPRWSFSAPARGVFFVKAYWVFGPWLLQQLVGTWIHGMSSARMAHSAHAGGFALGVVAALAIRGFRAVRSPQKPPDSIDGL